MKRETDQVRRPNQTADHRQWADLHDIRRHNRQSPFTGQSPPFIKDTLALVRSVNNVQRVARRDIKCVNRRELARSAAGPPNFANLPAARVEDGNGAAERGRNKVPVTTM
jgi:hypothetical protein